jgi:acyl-CoA synthetase (AMP-forming)/AMP-acid ligase II
VGWKRTRTLKKLLILRVLFGYVQLTGTTGLPKAAIITHLKHCGSVLFHFAGIFRATDRIYAVGPCFHGNGAVAIHLAYSLGTAVCMTRKFSATRFWKFCAETGANSFPYVGEFMRFLTLAPKSEWDRKHKVRECLGNGVRPDFWNLFRERFGVKINEFYTAVESNVLHVKWVAWNRRSHSIGTAVDLVSLTHSFWDKPGSIGFQGPLMRFLNKSTYQRLVKIDLETEERGISVLTRLDL